MKSLQSFTPRSRQALVHLARFRYLTRAQLQALLFLGSASPEPSQEVLTRRALKRLRSADLVRSTVRLVGGPSGGSAALAFFVSPAGLREASLLDPDMARRTGSLSGTFLMQHALATADVAIAFAESAERHPGHELLIWEGDWEAAHPAGRTTLTPDAHLVYTTPTTELEALVEADLGTEGSRFFQTKIARYLELYRSGDWRRRYRFWPTVLTVTPTERRATLLRRATETLLAAQVDRSRLEGQTEFAFASLGCLKAKGPLGQIWSVAGHETVTDLLREKGLEGVT